MLKNMSTADRIIRALVALLILVFLLTGVISGTIGIILAVVGIVFLLTSLISFCPIYYMFNLSTNKKTNKV